MGVREEVERIIDRLSKVGGMVDSLADQQQKRIDELEAEVARLREALTSVREIALRPRRADMTEEELVDCLFEVRQAVREVSDGR